MFKEKKHRLNRKLYEGCSRVSFTICVKDKKELFKDKKIVEQFIKIFAKILKMYDIINWVYVFMFDHFHTVIEGKTEQSNLWKAMVMFKQKTGYFLSKNKIDKKWQKEFYDHIHRKDEDLIKHIKYILDNPVRKGIVQNWNEYPFKGSLDFDLDELIK